MLLGVLCGAGEAGERRFALTQQQVQPLQVGVGVFEPRFGVLPGRHGAREARSFLQVAEQGPPLGLHHPADLALPDDRQSPRSQPGAAQRRLNVPGPHRPPAEVLFAGAVAVNAAGDVEPLARRGLKLKLHLGQPQRRLAARAVKNQLRAASGPQFPRPRPVCGPADGFHHVAFAAAVGTDDRADAARPARRRKFQAGAVSKGFEPLKGDGMNHGEWWGEGGGGRGGGRS